MDDSNKDVCLLSFQNEIVNLLNELFFLSSPNIYNIHIIDNKCYLKCELSVIINNLVKELLFNITINPITFYNIDSAKNIEAYRITFYNSFMEEIHHCAFENCNDIRSIEFQKFILDIVKEEFLLSKNN
jgi:hypothetical protein